MKQVLFMVVIAAGMLLAGCSKDSEINEMVTTGNTEQTQALTKEQIVGVWRSSDYWVSFSENGFMSAYLSNECIAEGDFVIEKDTVKAESSELYYCTKFLIKHADMNNLECAATFYELGKKAEITKDFVFSKTDEQPCTKENELIGKSFQYDMGDIRIDYFKKDIAPGTAHCRVGNYFLTSRDLIAGNIIVERIYDYYVYLPPYMYYNERTWFSILNKSKNVINIRKISIENDSLIISSF